MLPKSAREEEPYFTLTTETVTMNIHGKQIVRKNVKTELDGGGW